MKATQENYKEHISIHWPFNHRALADDNRFASFNFSVHFFISVQVLICSVLFVLLSEDSIAESVEIQNRTYLVVKPI